MQRSMQFWARVLCVFIGGFAIVWLPLVISGIDAVAHIHPHIAAGSKSIKPIAVRDWSFSSRDYVVEHQWMKNTVNIAVNYVLKEDTSTTRLEKSIPLFNQMSKLLVEYPNEDDYWEVVNRNLTQTILQDHPELRSLTVSLEILPRPRVPYTCISTVTMTDQNKAIETWQFLSTHTPVHHQAREQVNFSIKYTYQSGIIAQEYPDFLLIQHQISETLMTYPRSLDSWETIDRQLAENILAEYTTLADVAVKLETLPTPKLPYAYTTSVFMMQPPT